MLMYVCARILLFLSSLSLFLPLNPIQSPLLGQLKAKCIQRCVDVELK